MSLEPVIPSTEAAPPVTEPTPIATVDAPIITEPQPLATVDVPALQPAPPAPVYQEPRLSILVLDLAKPIETYFCLESIKRHVKVPHRVILCDNGSGEDYPLQLVRAGLADQLIVNRDSKGLGLGTRDLFAASFSRLSIYHQNDQVFVRDLTEADLDLMERTLYQMSVPRVGSISLAGAPCGPDTYSERSHVILTNTYRTWEMGGMLGYHGAGVYHAGTWREETIQKHYQKWGAVHAIWPEPFVRDNGVYAVRDMGESGYWCHRTDTKQLWCIVPPKVKNPAYPKLSDEEFALAASGGWPDGAIPAVENNPQDSFRCWDATPLAQMQDEYVADLRRRVLAKRS